jgi:hypothetical protein
MALSILIVLSMLLAGAEAAQEQTRIPAGTASIAGRVTDRELRRPLEHVVVQLTSLTPGRVLTAMTDREGDYVFEAIAGGQYRVTAILEGFVTQRYGRSAVASAVDEIVHVETGETRRLSDISLLRGGAITGRVTDARGRPLKDAIVNAMLLDGPASYRAEGIEKIQRSNARGEYVVDSLPAGSYYIAVQWVDPAAREANAPLDRRVVMYPSAANIADATAVRLASGETVRGVNIVIDSPQRHRLTGHFVRGAASCSIEANLLSRGNSIRTIKVGTDGAFDISHVEPGVYTIWARCHGDGMTEVAVMTLQIDGDVSDLTLPLLAAGRLTGRVVTADGGPLPEGPLYVTAQLAAGGQEIDPLPRDRVEIAIDGSFDLPGVLGERKLAVTGLHPMWVVDHMRVGRSPVTSVTVQPGAELHDITVVLGRR